MVAKGVAPRLSIRQWGILLFVLVLTEGALGVASAGLSTSGASPLLLGHITLGVAVVATTFYALLQALRQPRNLAVAATAFTAGAVASTGLTGAVFLLTGFANGGSIDRLLALASLGGSILMILWGRASGASAA